jgi:phage baseplate assembly protein W
MRTPIGSRVLNPTFGSRINELIDKPSGEGFRADASRFTHEALKLEPRINVEKVTTNAEKITIDYEINDEYQSAEITL